MPVRVMTRRAALTAVAALAAAPHAVLAQARGVPPAFPQRQITVISPLAAGGVLDFLTRLLTQYYQERSGVPAILEVRSGGAGNIGIEAVHRAAPDGTTLLIVPAGNLTINPTLFPNLPFDVERDFAPIGILGTTANLFVTTSRLGVSTIPELIAKAKTTKLTYGTPGVGSQLHLAMELFKSKTGVDITHVPYRGTPQALTDLIGGHIDLFVSNLPVVLGPINDGKVLPLAMTTAERSPYLPNVPTLIESGVEGIDVTSWYGLFAPKATPQPVLDALVQVTTDFLHTPELQGRLKDQGLSVKIETPQQLGERIRRETAMWRALIKERGISAN